MRIEEHKVKRLLVLGAGTAGTIAVNKLRPRLAESEWTITMVDPATEHHYQPGYLFLPFGSYTPVEVSKPISGLITRSSLNVGNQVGPQAPMFTIQDVSQLKMETSVDASVFTRLTRGPVEVFAWLYRRIPAVRRHGYLTVCVAERPGRRRAKGCRGTAARSDAAPWAGRIRAGAILDSRHERPPREPRVPQEPGRRRAHARAARP